MSEVDDNATLRATEDLTIVGAGSERTTVDAGILAKILSGLQQAAYIIAAVKTGYRPERRFKPSVAFRRHFGLQCHLPTHGSYVVPLAVDFTSASGNGHLPGIDTSTVTPASLLDSLYECLRAVSCGDITALQKTIPDSILLDRFVREIRSTVPVTGESWYYELGNRPDAAAQINARTSRFIDEWLVQPEHGRTMTVIGDLIKIDFEARELTLRYPPTSRELDCVYVPEAEESLVDNRREPLAVTGRYTLDAAGHPIRLTDVTRIEFVDLSPILIETVDLQERTLRFRPRLELYPELDETQQYYVVSDGRLNLQSHAQSRVDLLLEIESDLRALWNEYVETTDALSADAIELAQNYRAAAKLE